MNIVSAVVALRGSLIRIGTPCASWVRCLRLTSNCNMPRKPVSSATLERGEKFDGIKADDLNGESDDYGYFKRMTLLASSEAQPARKKVLLSGKTEDDETCQKSGELEVSGGSRNLPKHLGLKEMEDSLKSNPFVKPALQKKSFNLAAYVGESETLRNLVKLGVNLTKVEEDVDAGNHLVKADFEKDIQPYLTFLHRNGVADSDLGQCLSRNPRIFMEPLDDLEVRVNYLKSKKFSEESIARILTKQPEIVSLKTKELDARLGFLQREFELSGDEIRLVVTRYPKIAIWNPKFIQDMKMTFKDYLGFAKQELKPLLLADPKLYLSGKHAVMKRFHYIQDSIGLSHEQILVWPSVLRTRLTTIRPRHLFLKHLGRDQFDPTKENYVSLKGLATGKDLDFCKTYAKVPIKQFNDFMKTL